MVLLAATSPTLHYTVKKEKNRERKGLARDRIKKFRYSVRPFHGRNLYGDRSVKLGSFFQKNYQHFPEYFLYWSDLTITRKISVTFCKFVITVTTRQNQN